MDINTVIQEEINKYLEESPDRVYLPNGKEIDWGYVNSNNDYAFGYDKDRYELLVSKAGKTHGNMYDVDDKIIMGADRNNLDYAGRIWLKDKILSFWEFPPTHMIKEIIRDLEKRLNARILGDPTWKIETLEDMVSQDISNEEDFHWEDRAHSEMDKGVTFISPDEYSNLGNVVQRSPEERAKPHPLSPDKPIKGSGSSKYAAEKPLAYRQALMRSESANIFEQVEKILKEWTEDRMVEGGSSALSQLSGEHAELA